MLPSLACLNLGAEILFADGAGSRGGGLRSPAGSFCSPPILRMRIRGGADARGAESYGTAVFDEAPQREHQFANRRL